MKAYFILGMALMSLTGSLFAQEPRSFYVKADAGVAIGLANDRLTYDYTRAANGATVLKATNATLGDGFKGTFGIGYMFRSNFGVEAGATYSSGRVHKGSYVMESPPYPENSQYSMKDQNGSVYLNVRYVLTANQRFQPYLRMGLTANVWGKMVNTMELTTDTGSMKTMTIHAITDYKSRITLGVNGAIGCNYKFNERLSVYGELNALGLNRNFKTATLTKYEEDGVDRLSTLPRNSREIEFKKEMTSTSSDPNQPSQEPSYVRPMSYVSLSFGIQFSI